MISNDDWGKVGGLLSEYLIDEKDENELQELEKHGARLILSPDQKRLRPAIGLKMAEALDLDVPEDQLFRVLTAVEGMHVYSKGIDDIEDHDDARNGMPTLHVHMAEYFRRGEEPEKVDVEELGKSYATNYFLAVKSRNYGIISDIEEEKLPDGLKTKDLKEDFRVAMEESEGELSDGQNLDLAGTLIGYEGFKPNYLGGDKDVLRHLLKGNEGKTAELFALVGREVTMLSEDYSGDDIENWGYDAGQAFQIWDDVLDLKRERQADIRENNYGVPIYIAERFLNSHPEEGRNELGEELSEILRDTEPTEEQLERANYIITEETPAVKASKNQSQYFVEQANNYLDNVDWQNDSIVEEIKYMTEELGYRREK